MHGTLVTHLKLEICSKFDNPIGEVDLVTHRHNIRCKPLRDSDSHTRKLEAVQWHILGNFQGSHMYPSPG